MAAEPLVLTDNDRSITQALSIAGDARQHSMCPSGSLIIRDRHSDQSSLANIVWPRPACGAQGQWLAEGGRGCGSCRHQPHQPVNGERTTQELFLTRNVHVSVPGVTSALVLSHGDLGLFVRQSVYPTISLCHRALDLRDLRDTGLESGGPGLKYQPQHFSVGRP